MSSIESARVRAAAELASQLFFRLERRRFRFTLEREVDVPEPVRHENLTIDEVEQLLETLKMRGFHGG